MSIKATVLYDTPQREIRSLISDRLSRSSASSIVTGFATPGGLQAIEGAIRSRPASISTLVIGAATYPGFQMLDQLIATGVPVDRLWVHLGHTRKSGSRKNPTVRFHPMLHSKIYYMELAGGMACAFIGSHNMTSFALTGMNGEAGVLLEGPVVADEFDQIRGHIAEARRQAVPYTPNLKESVAWWTREFLDGLRAEVKLPIDWITVRTILIFAQASKCDRPRVGDQIYYEIPEGIEQIDSLNTETHLFLFEVIPATPWEALQRATASDKSYTCKTLGAENKQGNLEVKAQWRIEGSHPPVLKQVPGNVLRPNTARGMQQVRAVVNRIGVDPFEYLFDREKKEWDPIYGDEKIMRSPPARRNESTSMENADPDDGSPSQGWTLVRGLNARETVEEKDRFALDLATPQAGSMVLVSLRRRRKPQQKPKERDLFE